MIVAAAFLPHPPVLVPEVAQGAAPELDDLRSACRTAVRRACEGAARTVVIGSAERTVRHVATARGSLAGFGVPMQIALGSGEPGTVGPAELPLSLTIGAWLLRDARGADHGATGWSVGAEPVDTADVAGEEPTALVVMGDGSARRSPAAPGYFDPRAEDFDRAVARALGEGTAIPLANAEELLVGGRSAWRAANTLLAGPAWDADLLHDDAPYGVGYFVASWTARTSRAA